MISDPIIREVFSTTHLDHLFLVAGNETELRELVQRNSPIPAPSPQDMPLEFSESELAAMAASGITLDDAIRVIEALRR